MRFADVQRRRLSRARKMGPEAALHRVLFHAVNTLSPKLNLRRWAHAVNKLSLRMFPDVYLERPENGPRNIDEKLARLAVGGPFEPLDVALVNRAAVQLVGSAARILEVGSGTGLFASLAAADERRMIVASEFDPDTRAWAEANRPAFNIKYGNLSLTDVSPDSFDVVVALEVIEHVWDFGAFLQQLAGAAPCAIVSTPNKAATALGSVAPTPAYGDHVREWTSGEYYWVLRCYYDDVRLYTIPALNHQIALFQSNPDYMPEIARCGTLCTERTLIAVCKAPRRTGRLQTEPPSNQVQRG
jgi:2-polyprenyl-3-methyl-5-hydroxy-6-metoxy-1,4-benzoquinol methylase